MNGNPPDAIALAARLARARMFDLEQPRFAGMPIHLVDNPLDSVVLGTGKCVEDFESLRQVLVPEPRH